MKEGIVYIITNHDNEKHKEYFERLCNKSINHARCLKMPIAVCSVASQGKTKADINIDANPYLNKYKQANGLVSAELLKTHICEWSPFDRTLYLDCDAIVIKRQARDYLDVLECGYDLTITTCLTMNWKDHIDLAPISNHIFDKGVPRCFPYWNFGVFGTQKDRSGSLMSKIRENFLKYCFDKKFSGSGPHAQPAIVNTAFQLSPDHKIFTMPTRYNCHFAIAGGYVYHDQPVIFHMWKDLRNMILE